MWLAWSIVALAAFAWAWWRVRARASRRRALMLLCSRAELEFAPLDPFPDTTWVPHPLFSHERMGTENVVWDRDSHDGLRVFDLWYEDAPEDGHRRSRRWTTCAVVPVPCSCPRLTVVPRGIGDVPVLRAEVRFELDAFDRRFRVECEDRRFAFAMLDQRMMQVLLGLPGGVTLDASENLLVLHASLLPPERALLLYEAASALRRRLPRVVSDLYPPRPGRGPHERRWLQGRWSAEPIGDAPPSGAPA